MNTEETIISTKQLMTAVMKEDKVLFLNFAKSKNDFIEIIWKQPMNSLVSLESFKERSKIILGKVKEISEQECVFQNYATCKNNVFVTNETVEENRISINDIQKVVITEILN